MYNCQDIGGYFKLAVAIDFIKLYAYNKRGNKYKSSTKDAYTMRQS